MDKVRVAEAVKVILEESGADLNDENFHKTPDRVAKAYDEFFAGYNQNPIDILKLATFPSEGQNLIVVKDIQYYSTCAHHMVPFFGNAHVGYIPSQKIVGLSKIPRVVEAITRRLQIQEQITEQIVTSIQDALSPIGAIVVVEGTHLCCHARGARSSTLMITSAVRGVLKEQGPARSEFLSLIGKI